MSDDTSSREGQRAALRQVLWFEEKEHPPGSGAGSKRVQAAISHMEWLEGEVHMLAEARANLQFWIDDATQVWLNEAETALLLAEAIDHLDQCAEHHRDDDELERPGGLLERMRTVIDV